MEIENNTNIETTATETGAENGKTYTQFYRTCK